MERLINRCDKNSCNNSLATTPFRVLPHNYMHQKHDYRHQNLRQNGKYLYHSLYSYYHNFAKQLDKSQTTYLYGNYFSAVSTPSTPSFLRDQTKSCSNFYTHVSFGENSKSINTLDPFQNERDKLNFTYNLDSTVDRKDIILFKNVDSQCFNAGTKVQLNNGLMKSIEHLTTRDFIDDLNSIQSNLNLHKMFILHMKENHEMNSVILGFAIGEENIQVTLEATVDHPFFMFNRGWASYSPNKTWHKFGITCDQLMVGSCCLGLVDNMENVMKPKNNSI